MTNEIDKVADQPDFETGIGDADYEPPSEFPIPPDPGTYTFMRIEEDPDVDFKSGEFTTKAGVRAKWYNFRVQIQGGPFDSRTTFAGCNTLVSDFRKASSADDFIRACKSPLRPRTASAYDDAIPRIWGPFNAITTWEWRCKDCEETFAKGSMKAVKTAKKFTKAYPEVKVTLTKGKLEQPCPLCNANVGPNLVVTQFVVPRAGTKAAALPTATAPTTLPPAAG